MPTMQEILAQLGLPPAQGPSQNPGAPPDSLSAAIPLPADAEGSGEPDTPINDALGGEVAGLRQLMQKAREAAMNTPDQRAEKIYKDKIRSMFGVRLGEKNPKWKSILRGLGQGIIDFGLGYSGQPGIKSQARMQAERDYQQENAVLGKEGMGALAPLVNLAGQETRAKTAAAKEVLARRLQTFKEQELTAKGKEHLTRAKLYESQGKLAEATAELRLAEVELTQAKTQDVGMTPMLREAAAISSGATNPLDFANVAGLKAAGAALGKGQQRPQTTIRDVFIKNELTGQQERHQAASTRLPNSNLDEVRQFLDQFKKPATGENPTAPPAAPPANPGNAPTVENAIPNVDPSKVTTTRTPRVSGNPAVQAIQKTENAAVLNGSRNIGVMTPKAAEKFKDLTDISLNMKDIDDAIFGAATEYDASGRSTGHRYTGILGNLSNMSDRGSSKQSTYAAKFKEANDAAFNLHRKLITGAGAGWKELDFLRDRFPSWGKAWTADSFETSLQKALILHFTSQKHLWNFEKQGVDPLTLAKTYDGEKVVRRVDDILARYKELNAKIPTAPDNKRKEMIANFQKYLKERLDGRDMFESAWAEAQGKIPNTRTGQPAAPSGKRRIVIEVN